MQIVNSLKKRRTYYNIKKELPVSIEKVIELVEEVTELVPDSFNMKSSRVVIVHGEMQNKLWDTIYNAFNGKVSEEKISLFRAGSGTILYFYDSKTVSALQSQFPAYAENFPVWANQASAMLQIAVWSGLRELEIGASLQHYNPVIDKAVKELLNIPEEYVLIAQMPFGAIGQEPAQKEKEDIKKRVTVIS